METARLGELGRVVSGSTPSTTVAEYWDGSIPWVTPADLSHNDGPFFTGKPRMITRAGLSSCSATILPPGTLLFSSRAPIGHCAIASYPLCTNQGFKSLIPNDKLDSLYGYYALKFATPAIKASGRGATFAEVSKEIMEDVSIPLPPFPEQQRIARIMEDSDRLRRLRRYALTISSTLPASAFWDIFGDPVTNPHGFPVMPTEAVFARGGAGAKCGPFGSALKNHEYVESGIPVWTMENVSENEFWELPRLFITPAKYQQLRAYSIASGDILISRAGTVGRLAIVTTRYERSIMHSNLIRLRLDHSKCLPIYFTALLTYFPDRIGRLKRGQDESYTFMNTQRISELEIPIPPLRLQEQFATAVERHHDMRAVQREGVRQADYLFQTLLHHAFSGGL